MKHHLAIALGIICCLPTQCATIVQANDPDSPFGFLTQILSKAYDRASGTFFVGIANDDANNLNSGNFAISRACRPNLNGTAQFIGIAQDTIFQNMSIEFLAVSNSKNPPSLVVTAVILSTSSLSATQISAVESSGKNAVQSSILNDASGGSTTDGIVRIAASPDHVLAAVRPSGGDFGAADSGIALVEIDRDTSGTLTSLIVKDATTGLNGNKAFPLDLMSSVLTGDPMGMASIVFSTAMQDINQVALFYDLVFDRWYAGVRIMTDGSGTGIAKAVTVARLDDTNGNSIALEPIVANSAIDPTKNQIVVTQESAPMMPLSISALNLHVMHASTGPSYLIVNGGRDSSAMVGNLIFALPLVDNPSDPSIHGTLANKNAALSNGVFVTPATGVNDLAQATDIAAIVGAGPLPIQPSDTISDMDVIDDAVFVSISKAPTITNNTGIFYSQALFDADGKVIRWTPWRRATPFNAFPGITLPNGGTHDGSVLFFSIDAVTGSAWIVEASSNQVVGYASWGKKCGTTSLVDQLNNHLSHGAYSVLSLDQNTRGFADQTPTNGYGYALFGGSDTVLFALTKQPATMTNVRQVPSDFTLAQNFLTTDIPGCVAHLEYSRRTAVQGNQNYFFAGTSQGFFAFADPSGAGFNASSLSTLNVAPFSTGTWQQITTIPGTIIDIKSSGNMLYVLTLELTTNPLIPLINTLYRIPFTTNLATMFAPGNIVTIAQAASSPTFDKVTQFFGMQIIATGDPASANAGDKEQLVLATNQGLFISQANQVGAAQGIIDATDQTTAAWQALAQTESTFFLTIGAPDTPIMHTVWPSTIVDKTSCKTFEQSDINQLNGSGDSTGNAPLIGPFDPAFFNANSSLKNFAALDPITYFWSDGARRFFIFNPANTPSTLNTLNTLPYDVAQWNLTHMRAVSDPELQSPHYFFWVRSIGDTGLIMAGTSKGILALK